MSRSWPTRRVSATLTLFLGIRELAWRRGRRADG